jgi:endogenous inhibitor of DNA gyrase (YacG/DUF329 family)
MRFFCPTCKQNVTREAKNFPFCGERCQMADLGAWFSENYRVSQELSPLHRLELEENGNWDRLASEQDE